MSLPVSKGDREYDKFVDDGSGNVAVRFLATTASGTSDTLVNNKSSREYKKFVEDDSGDVAVVLLAV